MENSNLTQLLNTNSSELNVEQQQQIKAVYQHLKKIAKAQKYKVHKHELNTTALVNEAWIKLYSSKRDFNDRNHFYAVSAMAMRQILLNQAQKVANRSETNEVSVNLMVDDIDEAHWLLDLESHLVQLGNYSKRLEDIFVYRFFGGMNIEEIAALLDVSKRTIDREWKKAKLMISVSMEK